MVHRIKRIIRTLDDLPPGLAKTVTAETNVAKDLNLDSIATMDFIMAVETECDVVIPIDRIADIKTLGDLADVVVNMQPVAVG
jgi:acyl carrier protein